MILAPSILAADLGRLAEEVAAVESARDEVPGRLTLAVARSLHKLMAYKDEYEVARLLTGPEAQAAAVASLRAAAARQGRAGLAAVTGEHYEGGHWLATFATYLVTRRGIDSP